MIKQEIKILENKLSDGDLLKLNNSGDQIEEQEIVAKVDDDDDEIDEGLGEAKPMVLNKIKQQSDVVGLGYDEKSTYWSTSLCQRGFQNLCFFKTKIPSCLVYTYLLLTYSIVSDIIINILKFLKL